MAVTTPPRGDRRHPALAATNADDERVYTWKGQSYYSSTTILGGGFPRYALMPWAAKVVASRALEEILSHGPHSRASAIANRLERAGRLEVAQQKLAGKLKTVKVDELTPHDFRVRYLRAEPERIRDAAGAIGSDVHSEAEDLVLEHARESVRLVIEGKRIRDWPDELAGYQIAFLHWLQDFQPEFLATEFTVINPGQGYGGTGDAVVRIHLADGVLVVIVDYKSGNQVHFEAGCQLASYARGEFIALPDGITEVRDVLPQIQRGAVLHLRPPTSRNPKGYVFRFVDIGEDAWEGFVRARDSFRWLKEKSRTMLGDRIEPVAVAA